MSDTDVQRLEAERLRPAPGLDPVGEALWSLIGALADAAKQEGWY